MDPYRYPKTYNLFAFDEVPAAGLTMSIGGWSDAYILYIKYDDHFVIVIFIARCFNTVGPNAKRDPLSVQIKNITFKRGAT